jgi:hypothetical protein
MPLISGRGFPAPTRRGYAVNGRGRRPRSTGSRARHFERLSRRGRTRQRDLLSVTGRPLPHRGCDYPDTAAHPGARTRVRETAYPSARVRPEDHPRSRPASEHSAHALNHGTAESSFEIALRSLKSSLSARLARSRNRQVTHLMWSQRSPAGYWLRISRSWRAPASQAMGVGAY